MDQSQAEAVVSQSDFKSSAIAPRLYRKDATLWSQDQTVQKDVAAFLGWVDAPTRTLAQIDEIESFAAEITEAGFTDAVVLGMGGSSLSSLMFASAFPNSKGLKLHVLDSTVPGDVLKIDRSVRLKTTLFIVASKSGTTVEPLAFEEYFYQRLTEELGDQAPQHIVATTDPGSQMQARAQERGYRKIFLGEPEVGGRFSVFTVFGMVPAALIGLPVRKMLEAVTALYNDQDAEGIETGIWYGELAKAGVDKITFLTSPEFAGVALWAEQLIAESTGKHGFGTLPLATEPEGQPEVYGADRTFFLINTESPVTESFSSITVTIDSPIDFAELLYRFEIATATAGAILGVNPFDQPNVQAAKIIAQKELEKIQATGTLPELKFDVESRELAISGSNGQNVGQALASFLHNHNSGDVVQFLAFLPETDQTTDQIQSIRTATRDRLNLATAFGYGPRYLHSTGQYHKGGPNNGLYVVLTSEDAEDPQIPGMGASFGQLKMAQALGDIGALKDNQRRVVQIHCKTTDVNKALAQLADELHVAVAP